MLRDARQAAGLTQLDMANSLRVHETLVSQWETGRKTPPLGKIQSIAKLLGLTDDETERLRASARTPIRSRPSDIVERLDRMERKVDQISAHLGIDDDSE